ncbi:MAG TPA: PPC domain-containing protein [Thermoanaerobaculia bacterium]|nr:PPC domain-containing protein [Thermoanaerobaculia bacterium]
MAMVFALFFVSALSAATPLERDRPLAADIAAGEVHEYAVAATAGSLLRVVVEQRGIDLVLTAHAPDGAKVGEVDSPNGANGPEPLAFVTSEAGSYRFEVRSLEKDVKPGKYEIRIASALTAAELTAIEEGMRRHAIPLRSDEPAARWRISSRWRASWAMRASSLSAKRLTARASSSG